MELTPFEIRAAVLTALNIPVIPIPAGTKGARLSNWEDLATTDSIRIAEWARNGYADGNTAAVAKAQLGGVFFLEIDKANFHQEIEKLTGQKIPETFMVSSRPGEGRGHFYFRHTPETIALAEKTGKAYISGKQDGHEAWSLRWNNAYVVGPLSIHPDTQKMYQIRHSAEVAPGPSWLVEWCVANQGTQESKKEEKKDVVLEGGRNDYITSKLGRARQQNSLEYEALVALGHQLNQRDCVPPLPDKDIEVIAKSISSYEVVPAIPVPFDAYKTSQEKPDRPMENESINPESAATGLGLDWLPLSTLASTRLQDLYMEYFQDNDWPLTWALPSLVTAASAVVPETPREVGKPFMEDSAVNLYTGLIGPVHSGKSQCIEWGAKAIGIYENPSPGTHYVEGKFGSAEQLLRYLQKNNTKFPQKSCLINPDEWAHLLGKATIPDSSFPRVLTTAFYRRNQVFTLGGAGGGKDYALNLAMSFTGGIVEEEFDMVFGASTLGGLYDRFLFGRAPDNFMWGYRPCPIPLHPYFKAWDLKPVKVNDEVYEVTRAWGKENSNLGGRVSEVCARIATIYACLDGRPEVKGPDIEALKPLALYQMGLRQIYRPNPGKNPDAVWANKALDWINKYATEWTSIAKLKQRTYRTEQELGPNVAERSLRSLARSGRIDLWLPDLSGRAPLPEDYKGPYPRIGLIRRVK